MIAVRRIGVGEGELLRRMRLASLQDSPHAFSTGYDSAVTRSLESWSEQADSTAKGSNRATFIAFAGICPVGIAALYRRSDQSDTGELLQVWVAPGYRHTGVAWSLMDAVFQWAAVNGFRRVLATVAKGNARALAFYLKYGFGSAQGSSPQIADDAVLAKAIQLQRMEGSMEELTALESSVMVEGNAALLVIDVQQGLFEKSTPIYKAERLLQNIHVLVDRAHSADVPVFYVQHSDQKALVKGSPAWQLHPQLQPLNADFIIHKQHGNAFEETALDEALRCRAINTVVVTGLVTHGCVRATCTGARHLGYRVILVKDGHSSYSKQAAQLIEEWHRKLSAIGVEILDASEIQFGSWRKVK